MDETLTTAGEPQVIESANTYEGDIQTAGLAQTIDTQVQGDGSQVIETATPMDNNVTYQNVTEDTTPSFDTNKDFTQNMVQDALQLNYQNTVAQTDGQAMTQFLDHDYDYNKSEAGTYWVAGAINDVDTQMSFLNTLVNEEMYDELDLQKYYYDTTMATARAYAAQKKKETAYGFYRAAQEKAIAEAQLTGWYMPAEGNYMLGQYTVAQNKLEDPEATQEEKARAQRISGTVEKWFNANQIGTRGIKCLNMMNYEENVRHNTIMGELQKEANKIAASSAGASGASTKVQMRLFKFQLEEMELALGADITSQIGLDNDNLIGHHTERDYSKFSNLQGYFGTKDKTALANLLQNNSAYYSSVLSATSKDYVNKVLEANGIDPKDHYTLYKNDQDLASIKAYLNSDAGKGSTSLNTESGAFEKTGKTVNGHEIVTTVVGNKAIAGYFEDGMWTPITDKNTIIDNKGTTIETYMNNSWGSNNVDWSGIEGVTVDGTYYSFGRGRTNKNIISSNNLQVLGWEPAMDYNGGYNKLSDGQKETMRKVEAGVKLIDDDGDPVKNLQLVPEKYETGGADDFLLMQGKDDNGNIKYYTMHRDGELMKVDSSDVKEARYVKDTLKAGDQISIGASKNSDKSIIIKNSYVVCEKDKNGNTIMALPRSDGTVEYYTLSSKPISHYKSYTTVKQIGLTEQQVKDLGGQPLENKVQSTNTTTTQYNTTPEQVENAEKILENETSGVSGGGGSSGTMKSGIEPQNTVDNKGTNYTKTNVETLKWENSSPLHPYTETKPDEDNNNVNNLLDQETGTYRKQNKKGGK